MYQLKTRLFKYTDQDIDTVIPEIDNYANTLAYTIGLNLGTGTGSYQIGELVYQGINLGSATASAEIVNYDNGLNILEVKNIKGTFLVSNGNLKGNTSAAQWTLIGSSTDDQNLSIKENTPFETDAENLITNHDSVFGKF